MSSPPNLDRPLEEIRVKYKDMFHLKNLYCMMHEYLLENEWVGRLRGLDVPGDTDGTGHTDIEAFYFESYIQKGLHYGGKEMWLWWRFQKNPEGKTSSYIKNTLDIDFHLSYVRDQEIVHQGKKMKIYWGEMELFFRGKVLVDYQKQFQNNKLLSYFYEIFNKRLIKQELDKREKELLREVNQLVSHVKRFLNMRTFVPTAEPFYTPTYGYEAESAPPPPIQ